MHFFELFFAFFACPAVGAIHGPWRTVDPSDGVIYLVSAVLPALYLSGLV